MTRSVRAGSRTCADAANAAFETGSRDKAQGRCSATHQRQLSITFVQTSILIAHAVVGWALCGATIGMARKTTTLRYALVIYAVAAPIMFAIVSSVYFSLFGGIRPATTAAIFVVIVVSLDAPVIAPLGFTAAVRIAFRRSFAGSVIRSDR
jgi:hypothetical protein